MTDLPLLVEFTVEGDPVGQGSKSISKSGHMYDANAKTLKPWRKKMSDAAREAWSAAGHSSPFAGPVHVDTLFRFTPSFSDPDRVFASTRQDGDKLTRAAYDSLKVAGVLRDDSLVCRWGGGKRFCAFGEEAGVTVSVYSLAEVEERLSLARRLARMRRPAPPKRVVM